MTTYPRRALTMILFFVGIVGIVSSAYRYQMDIPVCPNSSETWWTCPIEFNHDMRDSHGFQGVKFDREGQRGWLWSSNGEVLASSDGGSNWQRLRAKDQSSLEFSDFQISENGRRMWLLGGLRFGPTPSVTTLLTSDDGGHNWHESLRDPSGSREEAMVYRAYFSKDAMRGWIVGENNTVFSTKDAGRTWQGLAYIANLETYNSSLRDIRFDEREKNAWIVDDIGRILYSHDGAQTWTRLRNYEIAIPDAAVIGRELASYYKDIVSSNENNRFSFRAIHPHVDGKRIWIVGDRGVILHSKDAGASWQFQTKPAMRIFSQIHFSADGLHGWATSTKETYASCVGETSSGEDAVISTSDGGATWVERTDLSSQGYTRISFHPDQRRAWLVGTAKSLLKTEDAGATWKKIGDYQRFPPIWFYSLCCVLSVMFCIGVFTQIRSRRV